MTLFRRIQPCSLPTCPPIKHNVTCRNSLSHAGIVVTCTGGHKPAPGNVGIRFFGDEAEDMIVKMKAHYAAKTDRALPDAGIDQGSLGNSSVVIHCSLQQLARLLFLKEQECLATGCKRYKACWRDSIADNAFQDDVHDKVSLDHLSLLFLVLRELWPEVPVIINGYGMLRRSLSLVAWNPMLKRTVLTVTAVLAWVSNQACGPMVRPSINKQLVVARHGLEIDTNSCRMHTSCTHPTTANCCMQQNDAHLYVCKARYLRPRCS